MVTPAPRQEAVAHLHAVSGIYSADDRFPPESFFRATPGELPLPTR